MSSSSGAGEKISLSDTAQVQTCKYAKKKRRAVGSVFGCHAE